MSRFGQFKISGVTYDLDDLTLNEVEQIEELAGVSSFSEIDWGSAKAMKAASFTLMRRTNPELTLEQAGEVKLLEMIESDEEMPDLPPAVEGDQQNGSALADSGAPVSPASTSG